MKTRKGCAHFFEITFYKGFDCEQKQLQTPNKKRYQAEIERNVSEQ